MFNKKGDASFGTIVGVIGSILIALGVAWLIAQNWHQMPAPLKIIILLGATSAAYAAGTILRTREYSGIAKALFILGGLLLSLSVFLIAQIYFTSSSPQGIAWLWMICWVGVLISAYVLASPEMYWIVVAEFGIWVISQEIAFFGNRNYILSIFFLINGIATAITALSLFYEPVKKEKESHKGKWIGAVIFIIILYWILSRFVYFFRFFMVPPTSSGKNIEITDSQKLFFGLAISEVVYWIALLFLRVSTTQGSAWTILVSLIIIVFISYNFNSPSSLSASMLTFISWLMIQYFAFHDKSNNMPSLGILAFYILSCGIIMYGLSLWHRSGEHEFGKIYQHWTTIYFLIFAYILSFQVLLPYIWSKDATYTTNSLIFLFFLALLSLISLIIGIVASIKSGNVEVKEIGFAVSCIVLLLILIGSTALVADKKTSSPFGGRVENVSLGLWGVWIFSNILFLIIIIGIIGYGTWQKLPNVINLGIFSFSLDVLTRYIGFIMDFWGYTSLALIFITGGIVLLGGGFSIEKWRRNLVAKSQIPQSNVQQSGRVRR